MRNYLEYTKRQATVPVAPVRERSGPAGDIKKAQVCRTAPNALIGLTAAALLAKCGTWYDPNSTFTVYGKSEQFIFEAGGRGSRLVIMYVYLNNGIVTAAQVPRQ